ncbi:hypothetical protein D041_0468B, partial [Vibrio parahaemolyticus EKP-008]
RSKRRPNCLKSAIKLTKNLK